MRIREQEDLFSLYSFLKCWSILKQSKHVGEDSWRVPWTARRANQSILKEISPGCSLEGLLLKLKLQYFGHLMQRADSFEKTPMLGKIEGRTEKGTTEAEMVGMASLTQWTWAWVGSRSWWWTGKPGVLQFMGSQRVRHDWATELNHEALLTL